MKCSISSKQLMSFFSVLLVSFSSVANEQSYYSQWKLLALSKRYGVVKERHTVVLPKSHQSPVKKVIKNKYENTPRPLYRSSSKWEKAKNIRQSREDFKNLKNSVLDSTLLSALENAKEKNLDEALSKSLLQYITNDKNITRKEKTRYITELNIIKKAKEALPRSGQKGLPGDSNSARKFPRYIAKLAADDVRVFLLQHQALDRPQRPKYMMAEAVNEADIKKDPNLAKVVEAMKKMMENGGKTDKPVELKREELMRELAKYGKEYEDTRSRPKQKLAERHGPLDPNLGKTFKASRKKAKKSIKRPVHFGSVSRVPLEKMIEIEDWNEYLKKKNKVIKPISPRGDFKGSTPAAAVKIYKLGNVMMTKYDLMEALKNSMAAYYMLVAAQLKGDVFHMSGPKRRREALSDQVKDIARIIWRLKKEGAWRKLSSSPETINDGARRIRLQLNEDLNKIVTPAVAI